MAGGIILAVFDLADPLSDVLDDGVFSAQAVAAFADGRLTVFGVVVVDLVVHQVFLVCVFWGHDFVDERELD